MKAALVARSPDSYRETAVRQLADMNPMLFCLFFPYQCPDKFPTLG